jgi:hypothetical protein
MHYCPARYLGQQGPGRDLAGWGLGRDYRDLKRFLFPGSVVSGPMPCRRRGVPMWRSLEPGTV